MRGGVGGRRDLELGDLLLQHRHHAVHDPVPRRRSGRRSRDLSQDVADDVHQTGEDADPHPARRERSARADRQRLRAAAGARGSRRAGRDDRLQGIRARHHQTEGDARRDAAQPPVVQSPSLGRPPARSDHPGRAEDGTERSRKASGRILPLEAPMDRFIRLRGVACAVLLLTGSAAIAQDPAAGLPPLIDRELFFGNPEISGAQLSPDGQFIAFIKPYKDTRNVWVKKTERAVRGREARHQRHRSGPSRASSGAATASTSCSSRTRPATRTTTSTPSIRPNAGRRAAEVPTARNLTDAKGVRAFIYPCPKNIPTSSSSASTIATRRGTISTR